MQRITLCVVLLALGCALPVLSSSPDLFGLTAPFVFWGGNGGAAQPQMEVNYQVTDTVQLLKALTPGQVADSNCPYQLLNALKSSSDKLVVFVGNQLDASTLRKASISGSLTQLGGVLSDSKSPLFIPYAKYEGPSIVDSVSSIAKAAGLTFKAIGCGSEQEDLVESTKSAVGSGAGVVVVCANKDVEGQSAVAMQMEVEQVAAVQKAVAEHDAHARFVYTAQPLRATVAQRRSLLGYKGFGPYTSCGPLCKTQVRWLEGMLAIIVMALASCAGMTCLYVLDTPSRFEVMKEGAASN